ncbi:MAG: aminopeptidase P family protein [Anaerolineales bacterium]|nr:aminopeptidase P family protein [Anaerolineales bacterium]
MKSDIDALMQKKNLDAILVVGNAENNPPMYYLTGGGHVSAATLVKKRGEGAVLYCNDMEREEAAKSGLEIRLLSEYPWQELLKEANGDWMLMLALQLQRIFRAHDVKGRVGIYGHTDISTMVGVLKHFQRLEPGIEFVGESRDDSLFNQAMETKSESEVARIREMGRRTTEVVRLTQEYLTSREVRADEVLLKEDGTPLTVGDVKEKINLWLAERDAVPSEGYIFAIGRDAGVPHSQGNHDNLLRLGQTIVFDIYPQERGGGYFYDFTRTWSLGYASPEAQELYDQVQEVYRHIVENMDLNAPFKEYQRMTCEYFESKGHNSLMSANALQDGYVHSLGHGVGINIHERPFSSLQTGDDHRLAPGVVITLEPGLYYPEKGMGFRIEDTYWVRPDGKMEILADYPYDFVLEMKKWKK